MQTTFFWMKIKKALASWWYMRFLPSFGSILAFLLRPLPISSTVLGPPKGVIEDVRQWIEEENKLLPVMDRMKNHWAITVRAEEQLIPRPPIAWEGEWHPAFAERFCIRYPEAYLVHLRQGRIALREGVIISPDDRVFQSLTHNWGERLLSHPVFHAAKLPRKIQREGIWATLISPAADHNYSHWMIDGLLRLAVLEEAGLADRARLIVPDRHNWYANILGLLGYSDKQIAPFGHEHWELDHLLIPSFVSEADVARPWAVEWLRRRLHVPETKRGTLKLYITRDDVRWRKLINEEAVIARLKKRGFQVVRPQSLSLQQQIDLFARAAWVVGPHGSGFTNLMFAPRTTRVLECFAPQYVNTVFYCVASALGQPYGYVIGNAPSLSRGTDVQFDDFTVDLDVLEEVMNKMEGSGKE
jgi:hypothetical protein